MPSRIDWPPQRFRVYAAWCITCKLAARLAAQGNAQWGSYGASPGGGHCSPLSQVTPANVDQPALACALPGEVRSAALPATTKE